MKFLNRTALPLRGLNQGLGCAIGLVHMTYSRPITISDFAAIRSCIRRPMIQNRIALLGLALFFVLIESSRLMALDVPVLNASSNDFAHMMPQVSVDELQDRLRLFKTQTGCTVVVLTVPSTENEDLENFGRKAFESLPLAEKDLRQTVLLIIARKDKKVGVQVGSELRTLFPEPEANQKLQRQVESYFNGMRPDLGIHAGVHYIFGVIRGDFRVDGTTEAEELENA